MFVIIFLITISAAISSCEKRINWDLDSSKEQFIIVDGLITNEFTNHKINLSLSVQELNDTAEIVSDALVTISDGENTFNFIQDTVSGSYLSEIRFTAVINKTYFLNIEYNNEMYFAEADMYPVSVSDPLPYKQVADTGLYYIAADNIIFNPDEASMYEILLDWSDVTGYEDLSSIETSARMFYYNLTTIDVNQIFAPGNEIVIFPHGTLMLQRKYSLSPKHEEFIRSLLIESQWHGGNFDIEEGNVYTNLSEGALGFFGASSVITYTSTVQ